MSAKIAITIAKKIMFANRKSVQLVVAIRILIGSTDISANHSKGVRNMRLIDADDLGLDTEWSDHYDGFTAYSQNQVDSAEEVKAIPVEILKDFRNTVKNMNGISIIQRLDKLIESEGI